MTPTIVYKAGGKHVGPRGTRYAYKGVKDEETLKALLADGWFKDLEEAVSEPKKADVQTELEVKPKVKTIQYKDMTETDKDDIKERLANGEKPSEIGKDYNLHHLVIARIGRELD